MSRLQAWSQRPVSTHALIVGVTAYITVFANFAFFSRVLDTYPPDGSNAWFLLSLPFVSGSVLALLLTLVCYRYTVRVVLVLTLMLAAVSAYFMDSYGTIIDLSMLENVAATDMPEARDLVTVRLAVYLFFLGVLPSIVVWKAALVHRSGWAAWRGRTLFLLLLTAIVLAPPLVMGGAYSTFFREHKPLRYYANPTFVFYSSARYLDRHLFTRKTPFRVVGADAKTPATDVHRELVIFVVGEAARADHFSLNGYARKTNPLLELETLVSFTNFRSCGTSTAVSVPCMFSVYPASEYEREKAAATENALDVLNHAGVHVLWLDNNSDSKTVADRSEYASYRMPEVNAECDIECRDVGMLNDIQAFIDARTRGDIFIVLHQMGQHGPAYYKRYPPDFEVFTPVCRTNELEVCTPEEIVNAYDNAVLYTDYFLSRVIALLKENEAAFETAMFFVSDHGESLGEGGLYLHGLPRLIAPDAQTHVPAIIWVGASMDEVSIDALAAKKDRRFSHDNVFHTILGFMEIESSAYDRTLDMLAGTE